MPARGPAHIRDGRPDLCPFAIALGVVMLDATTKVLAAALASRGLATAVVVPTQNADFSLGLASAPFPIMLALAGLGILSLSGYMPFQSIPANLPGGVHAM